MTVPAAKSDSFLAEKPRVWSEKRLTPGGLSFDVALDGKRVVGLFDAEDAKPETSLTSCSLAMNCAAALAANDRIIMVVKSEPESAVTDRIEINPGFLLGKPVIRGTRVPVELLLRKLAESATIEDLLDAFTRLAANDIRAALAYARGYQRDGK